MVTVNLALFILVIIFMGLAMLFAYKFVKIRERYRECRRFHQELYEEKCKLEEKLRRQ